MKIERVRIYFAKLAIRLTVCYFILSGKWKHWFIWNITDKDLRHLFKDEYEKIDFDGRYLGLQPYVMFKLIEILSTAHDEIDMALAKAEFEAAAHLDGMKRRERKQ